jgi:cell division protein FtsN
VLTYKNRISLGGFYRQNYGGGFIVRIGLNKKIDVGYGYEFAKNQSENYLGGSHEFQMKFNFGEKKPELVTKNETKKSESVDTTATVIDSKEVVVREELPPPPPTILPTKTEDSEIINNDSLQTEKKDETYILVIGSFKNKDNAQRLMNSLISNGQVAEILVLEGDEFYYVYLPEFNRNEVSLDMLNEIRENTKLSDAWFKRIKSQK